MEQFYGKVNSTLLEILQSEAENIEKASQVVAECLLSDGFLYVFGTGHSMMMALEMFSRAGGLVRVYPIFDISLSVLDGSVKSTLLERTPGYARVLLSSITLYPNSALIIFSNSGKNSVPVEMAVAARERGLKVIAVTSVSYSKSIPPDNPYGKRLYEVADVVIDNKVPAGDAVITIPGLDTPMGAISTIVNAFIAQLIMLKTAEKILAKGGRPEVWVSANIPGSDEKNLKYLEKYRKLVKYL